MISSHFTDPKNRMMRMSRHNTMTLSLLLLCCSSLLLSVTVVAFQQPFTHQQQKQQKQRSNFLTFKHNAPQLVQQQQQPSHSSVLSMSSPAAVGSLLFQNPVTSFVLSRQTLLLKMATVLVGLVVALTSFVKLVLDQPSRTYGYDTVGQEYDAWADDGILEYYWGEHIHLGYYNTKEMSKGYLQKNFIQAKYDFIDEMMKFGNINVNEYRNRSTPVRILDVGCGFGGTSRYLAKQFKKQGIDVKVTGITLSPKQVERGTQLAKEQNVADSTEFLVMNALDMTYEPNTFDIVWACESGEHMPDKKQYIDEMMRVLQPNGKFVMACWSQRDDSIVPFTKRDKRDLQYLYEEWTHPYFISVNDWTKLIQDSIHSMTNIKNDNWVTETIASWRHSIWVGVFDPRGWILKTSKYLKIFRDAYCIERMHRAFKRGLMEYGMFAATKK